MSKKLADILKDQEFLLFTTFKKSGQAVSSPMWFAYEDEAVYMTTRGQSWKVKRLLRNPEVTIGWCDGSGRKHGKLYPARACLVEEESTFEHAKILLRKKYGLKKRIVDFGMKFAKDKSEAIVKVVISDDLRAR